LSIKLKFGGSHLGSSKGEKAIEKIIQQATKACDLAILFLFGASYFWEGKLLY
jgi:hypothetical protein